MAFDLKFGTFALEDIESWDQDDPSRVSPETFPRRHGSIIQPVAFLGPRTVRLRGRLNKSSENDLTTYFNNLAAKLTELGEDRLFLRNDNRYLKAIKTGFARQYNADEMPTQVARYSIEFLAADPFWYSTTEQSSAVQDPSSSPHNFSVTNNGGVRTPERIEITAVSGDRTDVKLTNSTIGLFTRFSGTILSGQTLIIDSAKKTMMVGSSNGLDNFDGSFWELENGVNNLSYEGPIGVNVQIFWTERWA